MPPEQDKLPPLCLVNSFPSIARTLCVGGTARQKLTFTDISDYGTVPLIT